MELIISGRSRTPVMERQFIIWTIFLWATVGTILGRYLRFSLLGYGLSYTEFKYGEVSTDRKVYAEADTVKVLVKITNTGSMAGAETVQLYVSQDSPSLSRPVKELKGFHKQFLNRGEEKTVTLEIPVKDFALYDDRVSRWVVEPDKYTLQVASSSRDIKGAVEIEVIK